MLALARGGRGSCSRSRRRAGTTPARLRARRTHRARTDRRRAAPQPPPPPPPAAAGRAPTASPATLNARGHALIKQGRYAEAIEPLRDAVAGYKAAGEDGLPYAYALFNLAVALNRSGNPAEAVPLLRERLKYGNQRETVQAELDNALAKLGRGDTARGQGPGKEKDEKGDRDDG